MDTFIWVAVILIIIVIAIATILTSVNKYSTSWTKKYFDKDTDSNTKPKE